MIEVCSRLRHVELPFIDKNMRPYFKDVLDHVVRVNETIDAMREVLSFAFEAAHLLEFLPAGRRLAPVRRLGGDPGRADRDRRDLRHELRVHARADLAYGYFIVLAVIFGAAGTLFWRFRRAGWI